MYINKFELVRNYEYRNYCKILGCILLVVSAIVNLSTEYYYILRFVIFIISAVYVRELVIRNKIFIKNNYTRSLVKNSYLIIFIIIAILYNPLVPIHFGDKITWETIDILTALIFLFTFLMELSFFNSSRHDYISSIIIDMYDNPFFFKLSNTIFREGIDLIHSQNYIRWKVAEKLFTKLIELEPNNDDAYYYRGEVNLLHDGDRDNLDKCIFDFQKMYSLNPTERPRNTYYALALYLKDQLTKKNSTIQISTTDEIARIREILYNNNFNVDDWLNYFNEIKSLNRIDMINKIIEKHYILKVRHRSSI